MQAGAISPPRSSARASEQPGGKPPAPQPAKRASTDPFVSALAGSVSGVFASLLTHPLDVVRTKLAVERWRRGTAAPRYRGTFGTLRTVWLDEGGRGLFRGLTPALVVNAPAAAMFFGVYKGVCGAAPLGGERVGANAALGGAAAWVASCLAFNPLYVLKTKQQAQLVRVPGARGGLKYVGLLSSARVVLREQGVRGLYVGTLAACAGAPGAMIQMPLYERLKGDDPSAARVAAASAIASSTVGLAAYPLDVIRLRLQAQGAGLSAVAAATAAEEGYAGICDAVRKIYHAEGVRAFYRGCSTALIRSVPQTAIALMSFETLLRFADLLLGDRETTATSTSTSIN